METKRMVKFIYPGVDMGNGDANGYKNKNKR